jgi:hypothetical protein
LVDIEDMLGDNYEHYALDMVGCMFQSSNNMGASKDTNGGTIIVDEDLIRVETIGVVAYPMVLV